MLKERELKHLDRIVLAPNHLYVFVGVPKLRKPADEYPDYETVQREIAAAQVRGGPEEGEERDKRSIHECCGALHPLAVLFLL